MLLLLCEFAAAAERTPDMGRAEVDAVSTGGCCAKAGIDNDDDDDEIVLVVVVKFDPIIVPIDKDGCC
jgi:hypothetical protein